MALFAFLYRSTRALTPDEVAERTRVVPPWTLALRDAGRIVQVAVFGDETGLVAPDDAAPPPSPIIGCALVNAEDLADALALARDFPGRRFGTAVEVRPVKTAVGLPT